MNAKGILKQLFEAYPKSGATEGTVAVYFRLLSALPPDDLQTIVDQCVIECKFLPTVAEIYERHRNLTGALGRETAAEQWAAVTKAIVRVGYIGSPVFDDPVTAKVVEALTWRELCMSENQMADRAHFLKMYQAIAERQDAIRRLTPAARQLAERKGGLKPIADMLQLAGEIIHEN